MSDVISKMKTHHCWSSREPFRAGDMASFCGVTVSRINQVCNSLMHDGTLVRCEQDGSYVVRGTKINWLTRKWV